MRLLEEILVVCMRHERLSLFTIGFVPTLLVIQVVAWSTH